MKKTLLAIFFGLLFLQCSSIKEHNEHINDLISEKNLKADVDFTYKKLQRFQPKLYWYISKKELDFKFDSLKSTITKPMTSFEFYKKLSPVVASIRQGHLIVSPSTKTLSKKEQKELKNKGIGPFSQFEFEIINNKLYVIKNKSDNKTIKPGAEVIAINDKNTNELISEYYTLFTSDGYNKTFKRKRMSNTFPSFFVNENGIQDSLHYSFKQNDSLQIVCIRRKKIEPAKISKKEDKNTVTILDTKQKKQIKRDKSTYGYNETTRTNNRDLKFIEKDSSIALLKIKHFALGKPSRFYEESFRKMQLSKTKTLIIDLRNNPGGSINEISNLYSYLSDSTYVFIDPYLVNSKTTLVEKTPFNTSPLLAKILMTPFYAPVVFFKTHKDKNGNYYSSNSYSKPKPINKNAFKGKIYVMINGGTFSASSIISSNLKGSKRATFVGEETGGAYNGTVAGIMPIIKLPNSEIKVTIGLLVVAPFYKTTLEGHGIFPDKEILPTITDYVNGKDPELNWILEDIKKNTTIPVENQKDKKITLK
ncbi:S41 family peptidase [Flavobacterium sp. 5]|uniref:S41 family peptidase n=1 Tax=Flavobacterium sp. 5 TaxID=2035199 RepID=UPI000C2C7F76|nr:S41 family peptidase [Flavobacterium sp. 5]PKB15045.1 peptidase S41-like protein [Flavobacterium sp. 5]